MVIRASMDEFANDLNTARGMATNTVAVMSGILGNVWKSYLALGKQIGAPFEFLGSTITGTVGVAAAVVTKTLGAGFEAAGDIAKGVFGSLGSLFGATTSGIGAIVSILTLDLAGAITGVGNMITGVLGSVFKLADGLTNAVMALVKGVLDLFQTLATVAANVAGRVVNVFANMALAVAKPALGALSKNLMDFDLWIKKSMEAESSAARLTGLLKGTGESAGWSADQLKKMALEMALKGGAPGLDIKDSQMILLRFRSIRGEIFKEALEASRQMSALLGTDMTSAAQTLGMSLENPLRAMRALRSAGITLDPIAQELIKAKVAAGDLAGAQQIVLNAIQNYGDIAGGMAQTTEGRIRKLGATWAFVGKSVGDALTPLVGLITDLLQPLVEGFGQSFKAFFAVVETGSRSLVAVAGAWIKENRDMIVMWGRLVGDIVTSVVKFVGSAFAALGNLIADGFSAGRDAAGIETDNIATKVTNVLATIAVAVQNMPMVWSVALLRVRGIWEELRSFITALFEEVTIKAERLGIALARIIMAVFKQMKELAGLKLANFFLEDDEGGFEKAAAQIKEDFDREIKGAMDFAAMRTNNEKAILKAATEPIIEAGRKERDRLNVEADKIAKQITDKVDAKIDEMKKVPAKKDADLNMVPNPAAMPQMQAKPEKDPEAKFVGLTDMWKKVAEGLLGGSLLALQQRATKAAEQMAEGQKAANEDLRAIRRNGEKPNIAVAAPGGD